MYKPHINHISIDYVSNHPDLQGLGLPRPRAAAPLPGAAAGPPAAGPAAAAAAGGAAAAAPGGGAEGAGGAEAWRNSRQTYIYLYFLLRAL